MTRHNEHRSKAASSKKRRAAAPQTGRARKHARTQAEAPARRGRPFSPDGRRTPHAGGIACRMTRVSGTYGFAQPLEATGREEDVFIPGRYLHGALPGDEVLVALAAHPRREGSREGEITRITGGEGLVTGVLENRGAQWYLRPDFCPELSLFVQRSGLEPAMDGQKAAAAVQKRGGDYDEHRFLLQGCFGTADAAAACARAILYENHVAVEFPEKVRQAAALLQKHAGALSVQSAQAAQAHFPPQELEGRTDLRSLPIFTLDSASTKDMDDAIHLCREGEGWQLGVHIADVSHYVRPYSALDKEAMARGTSVYYADQVAPMLPGALSNDLCSLNPEVDRLAFSCLMQLDRAANVTGFRFVKTVIRSRVKGVYSEVNRLLDGSGDPALCQKYGAVAAQLPDLLQVYRLLEEKRRQRGSMNLESGESQLVLDEAGRCIDVRRRQRGLAECIIEELMILANGCAAQLARELQLPFVYRVHTAPEPERVENLRTVLGALGVSYAFAGAIPTQQELSALLDATRGGRLEAAVHTAVLRTMAKADYRPQPLGHYGLSLADYAHFTSPIRRYPDLAIHRILTAYCEGAAPQDCRRRWAEFAARASQTSSERELVAMTVERSCEDCYKAEYMRQHLGETTEGVITSVTSFGVYVMLDNTVEGLVRAEALCAGAPEVIDGVALNDPLTGRRWAVGDRLAVTVAAANVPLGQIDFLPAAAGAAAPVAPKADRHPQHAAVPQARPAKRGRTKKAAEPAQLTPPHSEAERTETKPAKRGRAKKAAEPAQPTHAHGEAERTETKPARRGRTQKAAEPAQPMPTHGEAKHTETKPAKRSRAKKAAEPAQPTPTHGETERTETKPARRGRAKKAAEPAQPTPAHGEAEHTETKPAKRSRTKKTAEPAQPTPTHGEAERTEAKPARRGRRS